MPTVPPLAASILDLRARLIAREAALDAQVAALMDRLLAQWAAEARRILSGRSTADALASRRAAILSSLRRLTDREAREVARLAGEEAAAVYRSEVYRVASLVASRPAASYTTAGKSFAAVDLPSVRAALAGKIPGLAQLKTIARAGGRAESVMRRDLAAAIADGYGVDKLVAKWQARSGAGALPGEVRALARTSMMAASNEAHLDVYRKNRDVVAGVRWEASFDRRTCVVCGRRHGSEWTVDKAPPLPAHLNCRCVLLPVFVDRDLNEAVHGVAAYRTPTGGVHYRRSDREFEKFLRSQGKDFRADFFPSELKRRAFESRKLSLADMVSPDGSIRTDEQIKRLLRRK